jgi:hypothetical protein
VNSVGSTSKPIGAMDARWQWGYACMIPRKLHWGYGRSLAVKKCQEKRDEEHTYVDVICYKSEKPHGQTKTNQKCVDNSRKLPH